MNAPPPPTSITALFVILLGLAAIILLIGMHNINTQLDELRSDTEQLRHHLTTHIEDHP